MEEGDVVGRDKGTKAAVGRPLDKNAVAWNQPGTGGRLDVDSDIAVLDEHCLLIAAEVGDGSVESDRKRLTGLLITEQVNGAQRGERRGRSGQRDGG
jgi:hypothetical protein